MSLYLTNVSLRSSPKSSDFRTEISRFNLDTGLPLGNLTSQLLVNIYMNEFDQFVKHTLQAKYYVRYADDFVILSHEKVELNLTLPHIERFLRLRLNLNLHPNKVSINTFASGVDSLGWVHFPDHRVLRTATRRRMVRNLAEDTFDARVDSYRGLLSHGNAHTLARRLNDVDVDRRLGA